MNTSNDKLSLSELVTPTGTKLNCKGWVQEAALRMLYNNLDPEVAERPEDLIVYGGRGKAARNVESFHLIVKALKDLNEDETLLVFWWVCTTEGVDIACLFHFLCFILISLLI